jgi:hypothetical protein
MSRVLESVEEASLSLGCCCGGVSFDDAMLESFDEVLVDSSCGRCGRRSRCRRCGRRSRCRDTSLNRSMSRVLESFDEASLSLGWGR